MHPHLIQLTDDVPVAAVDFARDLIAGLNEQPRQVSPKYFYDSAGSALFERICELPEYYPTRTEMGILQTRAQEMAESIGKQADIVEFGAGASRKIRLLLDHLQAPQRFLPVDISGEHLHEAAGGLRRDYPGLLVEPIAADFTQGLSLPPALGRRIGFFPGSSIGNFEPEAARTLLRRMAGWLQGGGLLIGVDLVKHPDVLHAAYNDAQGVTAAFNKNLLARANRELGADFDLSAFDHYAFYQPQLQRIEMHLLSRARQTVRFCGQRFEFEQGQSLHTENSYKYTLEGFEALARSAGFEPAAVWTDEAKRFAVHWLVLP
ncbi:MAG: L-histidine N(alpha)-methyltransferase [Burkholderiaceae bacterium]|nr:L-histidine N(alpha)-methyltransferase [Burkholderiaceae bacterium]